MRACGGRRRQTSPAKWMSLPTPRVPHRNVRAGPPVLSPAAGCGNGLAGVAAGPTVQRSFDISPPNGSATAVTPEQCAVIWRDPRRGRPDRTRTVRHRHYPRGCWRSNWIAGAVQAPDTRASRLAATRWSGPPARSSRSCSTIVRPVCRSLGLLAVPDLPRALLRRRSTHRRRASGSYGIRIHHAVRHLPTQYAETVRAGRWRSSG